MFLVGLFVRGKDKDVIKVDNDKSVYAISKDFSNIALLYSWGVGEFKRYD